MTSNAGITRLAALQAVPRRILGLTALAAAAGLLVGIVQGWPAWALGLVVVIVAAPVLTIETAWTWRHYGWLGLFYVLVVTQSGHVIEHVAQVTQIHVIDTPKPEARGIFGALDIEWVHFVWNTLVGAATLALAIRFRRNAWLWVAFAFALWHQSEHTYIMTRYLATGMAGNPGLLADGGVIGGGAPVARPDLHFYYNLIETTPIFIGFLAQLRHIYDEWFAKAFPSLPREALIEVTARANPRRFASGETIIAEGDLPRAFFVVADGEVDVFRQLPLREAHCGTLRPGNFFGERGLLENVPRTASVRARTRAEVLEIDKSTFEELIVTHDATRSALEDAIATYRASDHDQDSGRPPSNPTSASTA